MFDHSNDKDHPSTPSTDLPQSTGKDGVEPNFNTEKILIDDEYMKNKINSYAHYSDYSSESNPAETDPMHSTEEPKGKEAEYYRDHLDSDDVRRILREEIKHQKKPAVWPWALFAVVLAFVLTAVFLAISTKVPLPFLSGNGQILSSSPYQTISIEPDAQHNVEALVNEKASPSVVGVTTLVQNNQSGWLGGYAEGVGSGVIIREDGYILTNAHVVQDGGASEINVILPNKEKVSAQLMWVDPSLDLAIIKAEASGLVPIELGDSDQIVVGDKAIAIGNPLGMDLQSTLTSGYISGLNRSITLQGGAQMDGLIQTDAAINGGNSGGALLNAKGQLIGINTAKAQSGEGIGFAIPVNITKNIVESVIQTGSFESVAIGFRGVNVEYYKSVTGVQMEAEKGVVVAEVIAGSPAQDAKLKALDVIVAIDDQPTDNMGMLKKQLLNYKEGDTVSLSVIRDNLMEKVYVTFKSFQ